MITITLGRKTWITILTVLSLYGSYRFGYYRGWTRAFDALEAALNAPKEETNDGAPGYLDHSKDKKTS